MEKANAIWEKPFSNTVNVRFVSGKYAKVALSHTFSRDMDADFVRQAACSGAFHFHGHEMEYC